MANLTLPYSDGVATAGAVVDIHCDGEGGTALKGRSLGRTRLHGGGTGIVGTAEWGGIGVDGSSDAGGHGVRGWAKGVTLPPKAEGVGGGRVRPRPGTGVAGYADSGGIGVAGFGVDGGIGVYGESNGGFAMNAHGPTTQERGAGGWVKALAHVVGPRKGLPSIDRWFNSQSNNEFVVYLAMDPGIYVIDFGFRIADCFVNVTLDSQHAFLYPVDGDPTKGWAANVDYEPDGTFEPAETLSLNMARVALAQVAIIGDTMVQVECFTLGSPLGGGPFQDVYTRANHRFFVAVY